MPSIGLALHAGRQMWESERKEKKPTIASSLNVSSLMHSLRNKKLLLNI